MRKNITRLLLSSALLVSFSLHAQEHEPDLKAAKNDSLSAALRQAKTDTDRIKIYHQLYILTDTSWYAESEIELSARQKDRNWYAQALLDMGRYYYFCTEKRDSALTYLKKAVSLAESLNNEPVLAYGYRYLGFVFRSVDAFVAEAYYQKSLLVCKKMHNDLLASYDYSALGNIYEGMPTKYNETTTLEYYLQSLAIRERLGSYTEIASSLLETSRVYALLGNHEKAFKLRQQGLTLAENAGDVNNIANLSHLLGSDYCLLFHNNKKALEYELRALELAKTLKNNYDALSDISRVTGYIYNLMGDYKKSSTYYTLYGLYSDSLHAEDNDIGYNLSNAKRTLEQELERQRTITHNAEVSNQKVERERQIMLRNTFLAGFGIAFVFAAFLYWGYRKQNITNRELTLSNKKIGIAYQLIESKSKDITDSLNYARTIQKAVLVRKEKIANKLSDFFILTLPKDIVSGDFYFYAEEKDKIIVAACDCTGHGVPGALVSIVCSNALSRTIKEFHITEPGKILDKTRELVLESFEKAESRVYDGMDVSLCCLNTQTRELQWSGAYNPLWYVQKNEIKEIIGDKQPIGVQDHNAPFTNHTIQLEKGDIIYLFTDGYNDQFGGRQGKKFSKAKLKQLLLSISRNNMAEQETALLNNHYEWKGRNLQVDDILIIGIRV